MKFATMNTTPITRSPPSPRRGLLKDALTIYAVPTPVLLNVYSER